MNTSLQYKIRLVTVITAIGLVFCCERATAQDYFRGQLSPAQSQQVLPMISPDLSNDLSQSQRILFQPNQEDHYNLALGPLRFSASAGTSFEWTDNLALSSSNRLSDLIIAPTLNIDSKWRLSEINTLHFSIGLGYTYYIENPQYNSGGLTLSPNSELAFTIHVENFAFTIRDAFSIQNDPVSLIGSSNGGGNFRRFQNQASLNTNWVVNQNIDIAVSFTHYNFWVLNSNLNGGNIPDQTIDSITIAPRYKIASGITLGFNASRSWIGYSSNGNGWSGMLGPTADVSLSDNTRVSLGMGYQPFTSSGATNGGNSSSSGGLYASLAVSNRLNEFFSHQISISRSTEAGYTSNSIGLIDAEYTANWKMTPSLGLDFRLLYQHYDASVPNPQIGDRYGVEIGTSYRLTPSVSVGLNYRYYDNIENVQGSNYYQDSVFLNIFYSF